MKKITLLLILLTVSFGYSQQVLIEDFENSPALDSWDGAVVAIGNDPVGSNGQNMQVDVTAGVGQFWQGAKVTFPADVAMDLTTDLTVLVDIYSTTAMTIMGKVEGDGPPSADDEDHGGTGWETITFTFNTGADNTVTANGEYNLFAVFPNRDGAGGWTDPWASSTTYYDNITAVLAVVNPDPEPTVAAPIPTQDPADVISIFSGTYTDLAGTDFNPNWGQTTAVSFLDIVGNETMKYDNFNYQGTQLVANQDLSEMEFMHIDVWTPDATVVKTTPISATTGEFLVELTPMNQGSWNSYDIPVSDFTGVSMADIHQLKFDGQAGVNPSTLFIDNIYFWKNSTIATEPTVAAPIPTQDPADVISIFSGTYTVLAGTDFNPNWGQTTAVSFLDIVGNETMKYDNFNYQGTQLVANQDLSEMEFMHIDVWTPDATVVKTTPISATTGEFLVELTPMNQGSWNSYDIPVSDFTGVSMADIHQLKFDGQAGVNPSTLFIDNIYFWKNPTAVPEPTVAAPIPTHDPANVISMFSDAYTDVPVDTWLTPWSEGNLEEVLIAGNPTKKYTDVNFVGVETVGPNLIDASSMSHIHIDFWSPDANDFKIKLVDFGADAAWGGGDDTEHELIFPTPATETWNSYNIPLVFFTGLVNTDHIAQLIISKGPLGTIYIDNVYYNTNTTAPLEPTVAAPTPTQDVENVLSMFSDAYTDVPVDTWLTVWSEGTLEDVMIAGNPTKKYTNVNFVGVETVGPNLIDASEMTIFHIDVWTPETNDFKIKLVDFGADAAWGGGDDTEHELTFPAPTTGTWISYDILMSDFTNLLNTDHLAQLIMVKAPLGTIFVDNVFFYNPTLGINEFNMVDLNVYPNPTANTWNFTSNYTIENVYVYDVLGKEVSTISPNATEATIDALSLNQGLYIAKVKTNMGITEIKLIKK